MYSYGNTRPAFTEFNENFLSDDGVISWSYAFNSTLNITDLSDLSVSIGEEEARDWRISDYVVFENDIEVYSGPRASLNISGLLNSTLPYYYRVSTIKRGDPFGRDKDIILDFSDVLRINPVDGKSKLFPR